MLEFRILVICDGGIWRVPCAKVDIVLIMGFKGVYDGRVHAFVRSLGIRVGVLIIEVALGVVDLISVFQCFQLQTNLPVLTVADRQDLRGVGEQLFVPGCHLRRL